MRVALEGIKRSSSTGAIKMHTLGRHLASAGSDKPAALVRQVTRGAGLDKLEETGGHPGVAHSEPSHPGKRESTLSQEPHSARSQVISLFLLI